MRQKANNNGFSLIELVIVLVLIGILAAVAIPRFHDMQDNAQEASIRGTLGNIRSAIHIWRSNSLAERVDAWPPYAGFPQNVIDVPMPANPWAAGGADNNVSDAATSGDTKGEIDGGNNGWQYDQDTGDFWANSDEGPDGVGTANENEW
ncbi:MAG: type II secretion system protein [Candidatus Omnitrophica bacterium]|nr:type II secretion system protein [Candidatus Omnitrophota bacterium]